MVPTLCHMMGVAPPANADGRILAEAMEQPPADVPPRRQRMKDLNTLMRDCDALVAKVRSNAANDTALQAKLAAVEKDYYSLYRVIEWSRFGSLDKLMAHNREVFKRLAALAGQ